MGGEPPGERGEDRARGPRGARSPLRPAALMVTAGAVVVAAGFLLPDVRWRLVAWILGGMAGVAGLLTLGYAHIERGLPPLRRPPWRG